MVDLRQRFVNQQVGSYELGLESHRDFCLDALRRIQKRLGGDLYETLRHTIEAAFREDLVVGGVCAGGGDSTLHRVWITSLLVDYYDKMYDYQLAQRKDKVLFRGDRNEVVEWAKATDTSLTSAVHTTTYPFIPATSRPSLRFHHMVTPTRGGAIRYNGVTAVV